MRPVKTFLVLGVLALLFLAGCSDIPDHEQAYYCATSVDAPVGRIYVEEFNGGFYCKNSVNDNEFYAWKLQQKFLEGIEASCAGCPTE